MFDNKSLMVKSAKKTALSYLATHYPMLTQGFREFNNVFAEIKYYKIDSIHYQYSEIVVWSDLKQENFVLYDYNVIVKDEILLNNTNQFSILTFNQSNFSQWCYNNKKDRLINHIKKKRLEKLYKSMQGSLKIEVKKDKKLVKI